MLLYVQQRGLVCIHTFLLLCICCGRRRYITIHWPLWLTLQWHTRNLNGKKMYFHENLFPVNPALSPNASPIFVFVPKVRWRQLDSRVWSFQVSINCCGVSSRLLYFHVMLLSTIPKLSNIVLFFITPLSKSFTYELICLFILCIYNLNQQTYFNILLYSTLAICYIESEQLSLRWAITEQD